jgi:DNA-binding CsgD family transcriptional regulator/tetratricopeptide (TPR) repeat protein
MIGLGRGVSFAPVELLERDGPLAALAQARDAAARGDGRVVFVTGEPGIGKTSLVNRFVRDLGSDARLLLGTCDDLSIPRPLGAIRDLVGCVSAPLEQALSVGAAPHDLQTLLISELELEPRPTVLALEDVHWADDATLDLVTVLGRRIATLPALLVLTFRGGEAPPGHPLYRTLGAIRADDSVVVELAPLSKSAVAALAGDCAEEVYAAAGGNPFYVTELMACRIAEEPPPPVANAVLGRAARLDAPSRRLVELVSVVPNRVRTTLLDTVMPDWAAAAEDPERRQLLEVDNAYVHFRHELARNAIRSSIPIAARRRLHAEILEALLAADADPADIVHHAEAAGAEETVAEYALVAARRAASLESNRQAYSHYRRAADFLERRPLSEQAAVLEELARAAYFANRIDRAFPAIEGAIRVNAELGNVKAVGRCTRVLARFHWFAGEGEAARAKADEAIAILEPLGESVELARAYSTVSQLVMLAQDPERAIVLAERALELATRLGDQRTRAHALVNIGTSRVQLDPSDTATLLEASAVAKTAGDPEEVTRALANLGFTLMYWVQPEAALRYAEDALAYAQDHELHNLASYAAATTAWLRLRAGDWDEAERVALRESERGFAVPQLVAGTVLTELAVRRGDADAAQRLADLAAQADRAGDLQRRVPVLELEIECALLTGAPLPTELIRKLAEEIRATGRRIGWGARIAAWAAVAGIELDFDEPLSPPHGAMARGDWRGAAGAFGEVGWEYDRALLLSLLDDEESLGEAIEIARELGAEPLTKRVARRLRALGFRVPPGPRETTRAHPAGLTARQVEVLTLLVDGLTNAEIAQRLVVSPRTAEHHVAAVLTKLGATTRREAARRASELRISV